MADSDKKRGPWYDTVPIVEYPGTGLENWFYYSDSPRKVLANRDAAGKPVAPPMTEEEQSRKPDWYNPEVLPPIRGMAKVAGPVTRIVEEVLGLSAEELPRVANPIRAFHGSPHDFDAFDTSRIGTGEGAQAYGHGLYFAENEGVAKAYRDNLSDQFSMSPPTAIQQTIKGHPRYGDLNVLDQMQLEDLAHERDLYDSFLHTVRENREGFDKPGLAMQIARDADQTLTRGPGKMYEVALHADPAQFLDWDRPLSEQSEHVQGAINPIIKSAREYADLNDLRDIESATDQLYEDPNGLPGSDIHGTLLDLYNHEHAAKLLRDAGIPGIRYLDKGSRAEGKGTYNYVIFDPRIIQILRKYGIAGPIVAGGVLVSESDYAKAMESIPKSAESDVPKAKPMAEDTEDVKQVSEDLLDRIAAASRQTGAGPIGKTQIAVPPRHLKSPFDPVPGETLPNMVRGLGQALGTPLNTQPAKTDQERWERMLFGPSMALGGPETGAMLKPIIGKVLQAVKRNPQTIKTLLSALGIGAASTTGGGAQNIPAVTPQNQDAETILLNEIKALQQQIDTAPETTTRKFRSGGERTTGGEKLLGYQKEKAQKQEQLAAVRARKAADAKEQAFKDLPFEQKNPAWEPGILALSTALGTLPGGRYAAQLARQGKELTHGRSLGNAAISSLLGIPEGAVSAFVPEVLDLSMGTPKAQERAEQNLTSSKWWATHPLAETGAAMGLSGLGAKLGNETVAAILGGSKASPSARTLQRIMASEPAATNLPAVTPPKPDLFAAMKNIPPAKPAPIPDIEFNEASGRYHHRTGGFAGPLDVARYRAANPGAPEQRAAVRKAKVTAPTPDEIVLTPEQVQRVIDQVGKVKK